MTVIALNIHDLTFLVFGARSGDGFILLGDGYAVAAVALDDGTVFTERGSSPQDVAERVKETVDHG
jgi:hypothetical protein